MRLIIELLTRDAGTGDARDDGYVALANYDGELVSKAGVGAGDTHRQAAQEALNSLFSRRAAEADAARLVSPVAEAFPFTLSSPIAVITEPGAGSILDRRVEQSPEGVLRFLREALRSEPTPRLTLHYEDGEGSETVRDIYPSEIRDGRGARGFEEPRYLVAVDCDKDEPRTFRLDRIIQLETATA